MNERDGKERKGGNGKGRKGKEIRRVGKDGEREERGREWERERRLEVEKDKGRGKGKRTYPPYHDILDPPLLLHATYKMLT